jgi:hypothetical protein
VTFEGIDVDARPEGLKDLERLAIPLVPATVLGDHWVHGWNPKALAELVDVTYAEGHSSRRTYSPSDSTGSLLRPSAPSVKCRQRISRCAHPIATDRFVSWGSISSGLSAAFRDTREQGYFPKAKLNYVEATEQWAGRA